jgi:hypothetical protein
MECLLIITGLTLSVLSDHEELRTLLSFASYADSTITLDCAVVDVFKKYATERILSILKKQPKHKSRLLYRNLK